MTKGVLIFGATRGTGLEVARTLTRRGEPVTACVRPASDSAALVVECLDDNATIGRIFHTYDPKILEQPPLQRGEAPNFSGEKP